MPLESQFKIAWRRSSGRQPQQPLDFRGRLRHCGRSEDSQAITDKGLHFPEEQVQRQGAPQITEHDEHGAPYDLLRSGFHGVGKSALFDC
jgi:hypothetical protein